tara:strand:+ start:6062 stop:6748 length:687 start_codon:yes stop_codon:yes gene_type:complete
MAQHDFNIANQGFPATRADINNAFQAIASNSSGTSAPSTTFANQWFYNTTTNKLFIRNEANSAFIEVATLDQTNNEWQITTGTISAKDSDGLVIKTDDGTSRITMADSGDVDFTNTVTAARGIGDTLTDTSNTGSITLDFSAQQNFVLTLTGNITLANPSTEAVGQSGMIALIQDGTGGRTVSLGGDYETAGGSGLTLTATAGATDLVPYFVVASNRILLGAPQLAFS